MTSHTVKTQVKPELNINQNSTIITTIMKDTSLVTVTLPITITVITAITTITTVTIPTSMTTTINTIVINHHIDRINVVVIYKIIINNARTLIIRCVI